MRKRQLKVKAVIFDMDGVITNTMPDHYRAWKKIFTQEGLKVDRREIYQREGQQGMQTLREVFAIHKKEFVAKEATRLLKAKERLFKKIVKIRFIPGARRFLHSLKHDHFLLALVTGTSRHEVRRILPGDIYKLFNVVVTGTDVRNGKPHPEPYLTALKELTVRRSEAVVLENAPFGIESAKKAGLKCLAVETSLPRRYLKDADRIFSSVTELCDNLRFRLSD